MRLATLILFLIPALADAQVRTVQTRRGLTCRPQPQPIIVNPPAPQGTDPALIAAILSQPRSAPVCPDYSSQLSAILANQGTIIGLLAKPANPVIVTPPVPAPVPAPTPVVINTPLPQTPPQVTLPQTPPQVILPQTPPQTILPQTPPQIILPQSRPQIILPQSQPQIIMPQGGAQIILPGGAQRLMPPAGPQDVLPQGDVQGSRYLKIRTKTAISRR